MTVPSARRAVRGLRRKAQRRRQAVDDPDSTGSQHVGAVENELSVDTRHGGRCQRRYGLSIRRRAAPITPSAKRRDGRAPMPGSIGRTCAASQRRSLMHAPRTGRGIWCGTAIVPCASKALKLGMELGVGQRTIARPPCFNHHRRALSFSGRSRTDRRAESFARSWSRRVHRGIGRVRSRMSPHAVRGRSGAAPGCGVACTRYHFSARVLDRDRRSVIFACGSRRLISVTGRSAVEGENGQEQSETPCGIGVSRRLLITPMAQQARAA